jgi:hypothetical protein
MVLTVGVAAILMLSATAQAVTLTHTWNFHTTCYASGKCNDSWEPVGNVRTAPSDQGLVVSVSAYAFTSGGTGASIDAWLGQYSGGLGVSYSSSDSHTVDNIGYADYVVFEFSSPVNVTSYTLTKFGDDADSTWYVGNLASGFDFTGKTLANVNALGLTMGTNSWSSGDPSPTTEPVSTSVVGNYFILAASLGADDKDDKFKIRSLSATQTITSPPTTSDPVPEPGTLVLFGSGLAILGLVARRQANKAKTDAGGR